MTGGRGMARDKRKGRGRDYKGKRRKGIFVRELNKMRKRKGVRHVTAGRCEVKETGRKKGE